MQTAEIIRHNNPEDEFAHHIAMEVRAVTSAADALLKAAVSGPDGRAAIRPDVPEIQHAILQLQLVASAVGTC
jgi:hypothetical protein